MYAYYTTSKISRHCVLWFRETLVVVFESLTIYLIFLIDIKNRLSYKATTIPTWNMLSQPSFNKTMIYFVFTSMSTFLPFHKKPTHIYDLSPGY